MDHKAKNARWERWHICSLCKQQYHGVVSCALGWACWKTYLSRPEVDQFRVSAMGLLGSGLSDAQHHEDALSVKEAHLSMKQRLGASEVDLLTSRNNLAGSYRSLGRFDDCLRTQRDVYSGWLKLCGEENVRTLAAANNYAATVNSLKRHGEATALCRKVVPVARRVFGDNHQLTLTIRWNYALALCKDNGATLEDLREGVTTLEDLTPTARRVLGGAHPTAKDIEGDLRTARKVLRALELRSESPNA